MSAPTYARRFILIDVALNIAPTTDQKRDICQNAIGFAGAIGMEVPKVTLLAAVELVETKMQATVDGAILAKMADRGQIVGDDMRVLEASHDPRAAAAIDSYTYAIVKYAAPMPRRSAGWTCRRLWLQGADPRVAPRGCGRGDP